MAISQQSDQQPFTWVSCICGHGLWRKYGDRLEMRISPRGGETRIISASAAAAYVLNLQVTCEKCGTVWSTTKSYV